MQWIRLRNLCEFLGVSRRTVQDYEKAGLMSPSGKNKYGYLLYDEETVKRAEKIRFFQKMGFRFCEIRVILDAPEETVRKAMEEKIAVLMQERKDITSLISQARNYIQKIN